MYRKNYGAFLQAYALQRIIESLGHSAEIIRYDYYKDCTIFGINYIDLKSPFVFLKKLAIKIIRYKSHKKRDKVFEKSIIKHLKESKEYYKKYTELEKAPPFYDLYITGSDQVFNTKYSPQALNARLLSFVKEGKKMSYAASAGKNKLPQKYSNKFKIALEQFELISVRESGLKDFIEEEYNLKAVHNIDPTLILTEEEWKEFADETVNEYGDYIFYYRVLNQKNLWEKAQSLSVKYNLPIFVADGNDKFPNQIIRKNIISPEEWVGMMKNAKFVVTNSFHGSAFALKFNKRSTILIPPAGGYRIIDLLHNCGLTGTIDEEINTDNTPQIFFNAQIYFQKERKKTFNLLSMIMNK